jgi:integrase
MTMTKLNKRAVDSLLPIPDRNVFVWDSEVRGFGLRLKPSGVKTYFIVGQPKREDSPFVFPADWGDGHFIGVVRVLDRVCARAGLKDVTPHVLRHTFASVAAELGLSELTIAALLGHASRGITQRYVHLDRTLLSAADRVAAEIARLLIPNLPAVEKNAAE